MPPLSETQLGVFITQSPCIRHWLMSLAAVDPGQGSLSMRMPWSADGADADGRGSWHGGPIATLIDTAGAFAATMMAGGDCGTVSLQVDYLRPASGELVATARVRKAGKTLSTVDIDVTDPAGKLVAVGRGTFYVVGAPRA